VKAIIYVTHIEDFAKISPIRNEYFAKSKPVSTLVKINKTVKDGCDIEIEVIAIRKK
jgi:enamine deaminase RidA (YjgF/YER057c/UK114 family)